VNYSLLIDTVSWSPGLVSWSPGLLVSWPGLLVSWPGLLVSWSPTRPPQGIDRTPSSPPLPPQKIKRIIFYQYKKPIDTILFL